MVQDFLHRQHHPGLHGEAWLHTATVQSLGFRFCVDPPHPIKPCYPKLRKATFGGDQNDGAFAGAPKMTGCFIRRAPKKGPFNNFPLSFRGVLMSDSDYKRGSY